MTQVILASASPRRRDLLKQLLRSYDVCTSSVEERGSDVAIPILLEALDLPPLYSVQKEDDPRLWAWRKAADVIAQAGGTIPDGALVLAADTVVVAQGKLLGKPKSIADARGMLHLLAGKRHYVVTGYLLARSHDGGAEIESVGAVVSAVEMRDYQSVEVEQYLATGESMDKAGSYALQGLGGKLVRRVVGCETNVVGLPLCAVRAVLATSQADLLSYPEKGYCGFCSVLRAAADQIGGATR